MNGIKNVFILQQFGRYFFSYAKNACIEYKCLLCSLIRVTPLSSRKSYSVDNDFRFLHSFHNRARRRLAEKIGRLIVNASVSGTRTTFVLRVRTLIMGLDPYHILYRRIVHATSFPNEKHDSNHPIHDSSTFFEKQFDVFNSRARLFDNCSASAVAIIRSYYSFVR